MSKENIIKQMIEEGWNEQSANETGKYLVMAYQDGLHDSVKADEVLYSKERNRIIDQLIEIELTKWQDAKHCTCLGYAIIQIAGGEDSEKGKEIEKLLLLKKKLDE